MTSLTIADRIIESLDEVLDERQDTYDMSRSLSNDFLNLVLETPFELKERTFEGVEDAFRRKYQSVSNYFSVKCKRGEDKKGQYVKITVSPNSNLNPKIFDELDIDFNDVILEEPEKYGLEISRTRKVRLI